ncbi:DUF998 domain-containing protein [Thermococcus sp. CX2]|uniref:DUF998 domain-containing protein n=1 Tax=Thermococcus sp. CX2 TaxID=163006 RepID=UPI001439C6CD|nr:DUF998 domain-containing protein [Thermococcus sp. CX2]NJE85766.1 DUF998 domain-containing protein [Thermococcus sp. CX2]
MEPTKLPTYIALLLPLLFLIGLTVVVYQNPWFSFTDNALSDMGSVKNPNNYLFNDFIMLFAVLGFVASIGAFRSGLAYLMPLAMVSLFLVGVFPEEYSPHAPSAILFYVLALGDIAIVGLKLARSGLSIGMLWAVLSVVTFVVVVYMVRARVFKGLAIPELVGASLILAWLPYNSLLQLRGLEL